MGCHLHVPKGTTKITIRYFSTNGTVAFFRPTMDPEKPKPTPNVMKISTIRLLKNFLLKLNKVFIGGDYYDLPGLASQMAAAFWAKEIPGLVVRKIDYKGQNVEELKQIICRDGDDLFFNLSTAMKNELFDNKANEMCGNVRSGQKVSWISLT